MVSIDFGCEHYLDKNICCAPCFLVRKQDVQYSSNFFINNKNVGDKNNSNQKISQEIFNLYVNEFKSDEIFNMSHWCPAGQHIWAARENDGKGTMSFLDEMEPYKEFVDTESGRVPKDKMICILHYRA